MLSEILRETWAFQQILAEGLEKGIEQGIEQGRDRERTQLLQTLVEENFPTLKSFMDDHT